MHKSISKNCYNEKYITRCTRIRLNFFYTMILLYLKYNVVYIFFILLSENKSKMDTVTSKLNLYKMEKKIKKYGYQKITQNTNNVTKLSWKQTKYA